MARKEGYMISRPSRQSSSEVFIDYSEIKNWHFGALSFSLSPIYPKSNKLPSKSLGSYRSLLSGGLFSYETDSHYYKSHPRQVTTKKKISLSHIFWGASVKLHIELEKTPRAGQVHDINGLVLLSFEKWRASGCGKALVGWVEYIQSASASFCANEQRFPTWRD